MTFTKFIAAASTVALLTGCAQYTKDRSPTMADKTSISMAAKRNLEAVLAAQPADVQTRFQYRNPKETLTFLGIEPGMKVGEVLPGGGWYTKILLPYLGSNGEVVGIDYSVGMWSHFGGFATPSFLDKRKTWAQTWSEKAATEDWAAGSGAKVSAVAFENRGTEHDGTLDAIIMVRAFHHLNRFNDKSPYLTTALADIKALLKPGGIVGIVQHRGPETNSDTWAKGDNGYQKQSFVIKTMQDAGFDYVGASEVNANPMDTPGEDDSVWRLPPTLRGTKDKPALKATRQAIGETDRMTLKFRKR